MQEFNLPSPSIGGRGDLLRRVSAQALSYIEVNADPATGYHSNATDLRAFFVACRDSLDDYTGVVTPTPPTSELSAPTATRTSADGDPLRVSIAIDDTIFAGYYLRVIRSSDGLTEPDGSFTNETMSSRTQILPTHINAGAIPEADLADDGYTSAQGLFYQRYRIEREDGVVSDWSNVITDNIVTSVAALSTVNGVDKSQYALVEGTPPLRQGIYINLNSSRGVKANLDTTGKTHYEVELTDIHTGSRNGNLMIGFTDRSFDASTSGNHGINTPGCCIRGSWNASGDTSLSFSRNGANAACPAVDLQVGDFIVCEVDTDTDTVSFWHHDTSSGVDTLLGTETLTSLVPTDYCAFVSGYKGTSGSIANASDPATRGADGDDIHTVNFGATPFVKTPTTGYTFYG